MGDYTVDTYLVDVLYSRVSPITPSESSSLPSQLEGILGLGEASCNPTCMPPIYQSILAAEHGSCTLVPPRSHADKKEDMRFSVCFGRTAGKLYFDAYDPRVQWHIRGNGLKQILCFALLSPTCEALASHVRCLAAR